MLKELADMLGPGVVEHCLFQQTQILACQLILAIGNGTPRHILQLLSTPAKLHSTLHTQSVAVVWHTIMEIDKVAHRVDGTDVKGCITLLTAVLIVVHLVALSAEMGQGQIAHHHNGTRGRIILLCSFLQHTLPIQVVDAALHGQFMVEILIFIPVRVGVDGSCEEQQKSQDTHSQQPVPQSLLFREGRSCSLAFCFCLRRIRFLHYW